MDDSMIFMGLNARRRLEIVCAEIIKKLSKEEQEKTGIKIDILENKLNEELRIEEDMNFEFIGKQPEAQTADVEVKDIGAVNPVYADAVRQMRKADEKRAEYTELPKAEEREEAPKFKGSQEQKKMHKIIFLVISKNTKNIKHCQFQISAATN